ncbi:MAG: 23S rRNA (guanosine(2251)-2'-O)-methyltransferase RlmB [Ignavibacteria bacterium GWA2_55_11]|nr:MAG: 23S rRNA (guanosine(2251)-2'-O)-methyltransferase RlmB [Ignavibacteria bacterium GWA2_55_11]OGU45848.1 MAG: 23S rRNA (guanosine(2251)-2'-O)-methyltransferase RlmB [Ignavibacteria bacterium GWC2_56_12]OGU71455.1 MAG: 23S rRNA (guanosine(2251)-2'-O)-methyltransferase RlmB [Ignavibacteria bacterium RIFCSPLOWO2_12_FULL_56_21]OGU74456.1 MAG: 23S rRNA (guanosine(2251)-2'-O)-methyltransferase RlmB [Ignavibacteria bacterium RIFCSPLOWO2_02_FULL_55_14]
MVGRKPVLEALESGQAIEKVFVQFGTHGQAIDSIFKLAKQRGIPIRQTPKERFRELGGGAETQGVVAVASSVDYLELDQLLDSVPEGQQPFFLLFDEIEDPHNLGALIRSALCFGVHGVVLLKHHSATVNATVIKTSAGAALSMPVARVTNLVNAIKELKENGIRVVGTDAAAQATLGVADLSGPIAIVVGNEGRGIRRLVKENCDLLVRIPMGGSFDSLNASVAGALVLYEAARARGKNPQQINNER